MDGRRDILETVRAHLPPAADLPPLDADWITYPDPCRQFRDTLDAVGGQSVLVSSIEDLEGELEQLATWRDARRACSMIPGLRRAQVDLETIEDPHQLGDLDFAVIRGDFAVAENGAIWVTDRHLRHRAVIFIAQHVAVVVSATEIVHNMHQAYQRLTFDAAGFGLFLSGPSKTADIEQSLVIGAHGARSLTVFLVP